MAYEGSVTISVTSEQNLPVVDAADVRVTSNKNLAGALDELNNSVVRYSQNQSLTDAQKSRARNNIGAITTSDIPAVASVRYDVDQSLTDAQKTRARSNIGAITTNDIPSVASVRYDVAQQLSSQQKTTARSNIGALEESGVANVASSMAVRYDESQDLSDTQKATARSNIDAITLTDVPSVAAVRYDTTQTLTDEQKAAARGNIGAISESEIPAVSSVRYDVDQTLTVTQKSRARSNIGAISTSDIPSAVIYNASQSLSDNQKALARSNIGAISANDIPVSVSVRYDTTQTLTDAEKATARGNIGTIELDTSLTVSGKAADAKVVGDALAGLSSIFPQNGNTKNISDGGTRLTRPDSTSAAYIRAMECGFGYAIGGIQRTLERSYVIGSDDHIQDRTGQDIYISNTALSDLKTMDFGGYFDSEYAGQAILTLEEFLHLCDKLCLTPCLELYGMSQPDVYTIMSIVKTYGGDIYTIGANAVTANYVLGIDSTQFVKLTYENYSSSVEDDLTSILTNHPDAKLMVSYPYNNSTWTSQVLTTLAGRGIKMAPNGVNNEASYIAACSGKHYIHDLICSGEFNPTAYSQSMDNNILINT